MISKKKLTALCRKLGAATVAKNSNVSLSTIYRRLKGINLKGRKRSGRKKKELNAQIS